MHLNQPRILLLLFALCVVFPPASAQASFELCFRGKLADIEGEHISQEHFDLKVQISKKHASEILYAFRTSTYSDEDGWFGFVIPALSGYLPDGNEHMQPLNISLEILPNKDTEWMREGDDFLVSYTLKPYPDSAGSTFVMMRMEGSELQVHSEEHLYAFKDLDPFAYLLGGFLITDHPPLSDQNLMDLQQWLSPDPAGEEGETSRGVKGSFPSGGYYKKK
jgi:hypothetical protein